MSVPDDRNQASCLIQDEMIALITSTGADIDQHVGRRVRRRRRLLGLTQRQLGDIIGIRFQQIHKYETGGNRISAARLWSLAEALDVQVDYFFEGLASNTDSMGDGRHKNDQDEQRVDR